jgi:hypothetical protein
MFKTKPMFKPNNTTTTIFLVSSHGLIKLKHIDFNNRNSCSTELAKASNDIL